MSIKTKIAALALATLAVTGGIASTTTQAQAKPEMGWSRPSSAPPSSAPRSPPRARGYYTTAIAAAAGFASSTPTATTWAAFAPAISDRLTGAALCSRSDRGSCVRHGRLIHPVSHPTRPVVPPGGSTFLADRFAPPCCPLVTHRCYSAPPTPFGSGFLPREAANPGGGGESLFAGDSMIAGITKNSAGTLALEPAR